MLQLAEGDFHYRGEVSGKDDQFDALVTGLNILGEELLNQRERRSAAEELLQDAIEHYEHAPAYFCSVDVSTLRILKCNQSLARMHGCSKEELLDKSFMDLFSNEDQSTVLGLFSALRQGKSMDVRMRLACHSNRFRTVSVTASVAHNESGECVRYLVVMRDRTEHDRLERQMHQAQKMEAIGLLAGGLAHDLNNVLMVILGGGDVLRPQLGRESGEVLDEMMQAAETASQLTQWLLGFASKQPVKRKNISVEKVFESIIPMLRRLIPDHIVVNFRTEPNLQLIQMAPGQLEQVLLNIALNASDAMLDGGRLSFEACNVEDGDDKWVHIQAKDEGVGMSEEALQRAIEPFYTSKEVGKNAGLGLATCYSIIQQANGRIVLNSQVDEGTTVHLFLPQATVTTNEEVARPTRQNKVDGLVLVVEDELQVRNITCQMLNQLGCDVLLASDGLEAIDVLQHSERPIDLIITDVVMPRMGGIEFVKKAREILPAVPVLYISGYAPDFPRDKLLDPKVDFLSKPFERGQFFACVEKKLQSQ